MESGTRTRRKLSRASEKVQKACVPKTRKLDTKDEILSYSTPVGCPKKR